MLECFRKIIRPIPCFVFSKKQSAILPFPAEKTEQGQADRWRGAEGRGEGERLLHPETVFYNYFSSDGIRNAAKFFLIIVALILSGGNAFSQSVAEPTREERDGQALAEKLRSSIPEEASEIRGIFKIRSAKYKVTNDVPVICQIVLGETSWETVYETKATSHLGAEKLVVRHFPDQPSEYLYARAETPAAPLPEPKKLSPAAAEIPLASSDFWLTDLGLEFLHWPQQHRRGPRDREPALRLGRAYDILESVNPAGKEVVRVKSCIDKETGGILVAEAFDAQNKLAKEFTLSSSSFKKVKGVWQLERMTMMNPPKKSTTVLQFDLSKE